MSAYAQTLESVMDAILANDPRYAGALLRGKEHFPASAQLAVYADGYRLRLIEVLENAYPALHYLLGDTPFRALAQAYVEAKPSRHFNIDQYPTGFARYIINTFNCHSRAGGNPGQDPRLRGGDNRGDEEFENVGKEFFGELATLEEAMHEVYRMEESAPLTRNWAAVQTPDSLEAAILLPRAASRLLAFAYPAEDYLADFRAGKNPAPPAPARTHLLVFRHRNQVRRLPLEAGEHLLLSLLACGIPFKKALEDERFTENDAQAVMGWLARWVHEGCLRMPV